MLFRGASVVSFAGGETQESSRRHVGPQGRPETGREAGLGEDTRQAALRTRPEGCPGALGESAQQDQLRVKRKEKCHRAANHCNLSCSSRRHRARR